MGSITPSSHRACPPSYVPSKEASNILTTHLASDLSRLNIPIDLVKKHLDAVSFTSTTEQVYFPIAFKETETLAALKALEGSVAAAIADVRFGAKSDGSGRQVHISLEKATAFAFQAYVATIGGLGKLDPGVKALLKNTDLLSAQADPYRRMSANLYETKSQGKYYHIHGSLEASTTLAMIGLEPFRPDLDGDYESIIKTIETKVKGFTVEELEKMNAEKRQAGVPVLKHEEFLKTPHVRFNLRGLCKIMTDNDGRVKLIKKSQLGQWNSWNPTHLQHSFQPQRWAAQLVEKYSTASKFLKCVESLLVQLSRASSANMVRMFSRSPAPISVTSRSSRSMETWGNTLLILI